VLWWFKFGSVGTSIFLSRITVWLANPCELRQLFFLFGGSFAAVLSTEAPLARLFPSSIRIAFRSSATTNQFIKVASTTATISLAYCTVISSDTRNRNRDDNDTVYRTRALYHAGGVNPRTFVTIGRGTVNVKVYLAEAVVLSSRRLSSGRSHKPKGLWSTLPVPHRRRVGSPDIVLLED
jgi:hypothetical protein